MVNIGEMNVLPVVRMHALGAFLDGGKTGEILLPQRYVLAGCKIGDNLNVFVYKDSDGQWVATTQQPAAQVGEVAWLKVAEVNNVGAFLEWGLPKDLLCPYGEQYQTMEVGRKYLVIVFLDDQNRIAASARIDEFLEDENQARFTEGQEVALLVADKTHLGIKAIVDNTHWGVLYENELFSPVRKGQKITGYIKKIRPDDRLDLSLQKPGYSRQRVQGLSDQILQAIDNHGGFLSMYDKTPPEAIYALFGVSKKAFKQAIGGLYKQRMIVIEEGGVRRSNDNN